jgi:hypothetical protein
MSFIYIADSAGALSGPVSLPVVPGVGVQVPENAIELADVLPPCDPARAWALVDGESVQLMDRRGLVYQTETGAALVWSALGDLPEGVTSAPFPGPYHVWRSGAWELDEAAQASATAALVLAERDSRLRAAQLRIAPLQYAVNLDMATEPEKAALLAWMRYSVSLNRVEQQSGYPLAIEWPSPPDVTATP